MNVEPQPFGLASHASLRMTGVLNIDCRSPHPAGPFIKKGINGILKWNYTDFGKGRDFDIRSSWFDIRYSFLNPGHS